ncbi:Norsolorinic acid ketoreductase nor1 [Colletotrichum orbiculare MAFF 240422]|uniref:Norsolorinic acid ketoreductase nor1 n=1 Tax=Colletotrichum orbiculare (strain 104-T / ATCC 96160 / CBS 514.97 / LARS 414 / MAFF 240422) TaxID=1213857 RepID=A0A484FBR7_COLOR|nr:Norsolorinic acid ketoreductase nor1 [Colletotrichum orbiculare MAFF 240422]
MVSPNLARFLSDLTLGFSDGLTVPFALTAGLSSLGRSETVIYAGLAELCAGCISMGIGGYLAARDASCGTNSAVRRSSESGEEAGILLERPSEESLEEDDEEKDRTFDENTELGRYLQPLGLPESDIAAIFEAIETQPGGLPRVAKRIASIQTSNEVETYLITGANRGIGRGFVTFLLQRPSTTVVAAVRDPSHTTSQSLSSLAAAKGSKLVIVKIDSAIDSDPAAAISALQTEHNIAALDAVVANAGIAADVTPAAKLDTDLTLDHFRINAIAPMHLAGAAFPLLSKSANPVFVAISSVAGSIELQEKLVGVLGDMSPYGASKAALAWFVRRLHFEEPWLTSFTFQPGLVETEMGDRLARKVGMDLSNLGAISVETSVESMVAVLDGATREIGGTFRKYDGSVLPW